MEASPNSARENSLLQRLVPPVLCGIAGIFITIGIAHIPYSFSSLLLSGFLIAFIVTHILWFHKAVQPLRHTFGRSEALKPKPSSLPQTCREKEHAQDLLMEGNFFHLLQERLSIAHQPYIQAQSLHEDKTRLVHSNGLIDLLKNNQLEVLAQPIVNLPQKRLAFFSCIPCIPIENGELATLKIDLGSKSNFPFNPAIDKIILFQTLQFIRRHHAIRPHHGFVCPIPPSICKDPHFIKEISEFLYQSHFPFSGLIFEVSLEDVFLDGTESITNPFSQLKQYGVRFMGTWPNKALPANLPDIATPAVDFILLPYASLSSWLKGQPRRQSLASLGHILQMAPQTIVSHVQQEQDLYFNLPLPFDFASGEAFGLPKPFHCIQA